MIGVLMHFGVAFGWSAVFLLVLHRVPWIRGLLAGRGGVLKVAALYGPFIGWSCPWRSSPCSPIGRP